MVEKILKAFAGNAPAYRMAAEVFASRHAANEWLALPYTFTLAFFTSLGDSEK